MSMPGIYTADKAGIWSSAQQRMQFSCLATTRLWSLHDGPCLLWHCLTETGSDDPSAEWSNAAEKTKPHENSRILIVKQDFNDNQIPFTDKLLRTHPQKALIMRNEKMQEHTCCLCGQTHQITGWFGHSLVWLYSKASAKREEELTTHDKVRKTTKME